MPKSLKGKVKKAVLNARQAKATLRENPRSLSNGEACALPVAKVNGLKANGHSRLNGHSGPNGHATANGTAIHSANGTIKQQKSLAPTNGRAAKVKISPLVQQDLKLVSRCLAGDATAWSQMYERFHGSLLTSIRAFLGRAGQDMHLVDEISARVWYALVRNQFDLLSRFDPERGCRLSTFLSVLGKSEARLLLRSERRRKTRECVASRREIEPADVESHYVLSDDDFLATLSPRERSFYLDILVATTVNDPNAEFTRQNQWQLRHRVRKKLEQFLE